jgi:hypothetical protein
VWAAQRAPIERRDPFFGRKAARRAVFLSIVPHTLERVPVNVDALERARPMALDSDYARCSVHGNDDPGYDRRRA